MASMPHDGSSFSHQQYSDGPRTDWWVLALAIFVPILVGYFGVVRPTTTQMTLMRGQVARLEATLHDLKAMTPTAQRSVGLLTRLTEQKAAMKSAERTLDQIDELQDRLVFSMTQTEAVARGLDQLDELQVRIEEQSALLSQANGALATLAALPAELELSIEQASRAAPAVAKVRQLGDRLATAKELSAEAGARIDAVLDSQHALLKGADSLALANETLAGLMGLEAKLTSPMLSVAASEERLGELLRLKDSVLDQTADLPEAFETLELMVGLTSDYHRASGVLRTVQRLMADLVLLEPSIARIATVVEPILERTSLSQLGGTELRLVLQELQRRYAEATNELNTHKTVAAKPQAAAAK